MVPVTARKKKNTKKNCWGDVDADGVAPGAGDRAGQGRKRDRSEWARVAVG